MRENTFEMARDAADKHSPRSYLANYRGFKRSKQAASAYYASLRRSTEDTAIKLTALKLCKFMRFKNKDRKRILPSGLGFTKYVGYNYP